MSLTKVVLRFAAPVPHVEIFDRYLFIGPHPDDIEIGCGATVARLADMGKSICFLICTDGRYGLANAPEGTTETSLIAIRREEAIRSAATLGVSDVRFLSLQDGAGYSMEDMIRGISSIVSDYCPDIIFAPDPESRSECHEDHLRTGLAARQIACFAPYPGIMKKNDAGSADVQAIAFYMTAHPNRYVGTRGYMEKQFSSIFDCHLSQYPKGCADAKAVHTYLKLRSVDFGLRSLKRSAEGFRVLGKTQMHCLPEAGM